MANPFAVEDLRKHILSFWVQERCIECHKPVTDTLHTKPLYYTSTTWRRAKCEKSKDYIVCNWCYHYVWNYH